MNDYKRGIAICHYERYTNLKMIVENLIAFPPSNRGNMQIVICDDGSECDIRGLIKGQTAVVGPNRGVAFNKNRALKMLADAHFICILEDDLIPIAPGWFDIYEDFVQLTAIQHLCRVQKLVDSKTPIFDKDMLEKGFTPMYGPKVRGDLTFITKNVVDTVGGFDTQFKGAGYAHVEWSNRVNNSGLIVHPNTWIDVKEANDCFVQEGDTYGGRWKDIEETNKQIAANKLVYQNLKETIYKPITF